jgi:hypothetical protein
VSQKIHLDLYSPFEETLFIDSDCLVLSNLDSFWKAFSGQYFGVPGWRELRRGDSDPFLDVDFVLDHFELDYLPKFNGGTYYFRRCDQTSRFFAKARELLADSKNLRLATFRQDSPADESLFSIAMALEGLHSTSMGAKGMWTPASSRGAIELDVQRGWCSFEKEGHIVYPEIVHFASHYAYSFAYFRECVKLTRLFGSRSSWRKGVGKAFLRSAAWECMHGAKALAQSVLRPGRVDSSFT